MKYDLYGTYEPLTITMNEPHRHESNPFFYNQSKTQFPARLIFIITVKIFS